MNQPVRLTIMALLTVMAGSVDPYPLYGSEERGIARVEADRLMHEGIISGRQKLPGELLTLEQVDIRLTRHQALTIPAQNPMLSAAIRALLGERSHQYAIAVLAMSDPDHPVYATHAAQRPRALGSIGKVIVAMALFQALADVYPDDQQKRLDLLRDTQVRVGELTVGDPHKVRFWDSETQTLVRRTLNADDHATLWEHLDWMLSASSNTAANVIMQQAMLLNQFGQSYPLTLEESDTFFRHSSRDVLGELFYQTFVQPLERNGLDQRKFRQGTFFGQRLRKLIPATPTHASARGILTFLLRLEQGLIVDSFSSRELKRLLYVTERRVRYAASPVLRDAAVYFKSGSLYTCEPEVGYQCRQFLGNRLNVMNSMAIVESPAGEARHFYLIVLMSNMPRRNSALDHQVIAGRIHELIVAKQY